MRQIMPMQSIGVLAESELSPSARLVAVMLMHHVNRKNGLCYPSVSTLASDCGCQPTTIKKALAELKDLGFINWETKQLPRVSTRVNHYSLLFAHWSEYGQWNDQSPDQSNDQSPDQSNDQSNAQSNDQSPDQSISDQSNDQSPDQSISGHNPIEPIEPEEIYITTPDGVVVDAVGVSPRPEHGRQAHDETTPCHVSPPAGEESTGKYAQETNVLPCNPVGELRTHGENLAGIAHESRENNFRDSLLMPEENRPSESKSGKSVCPPCPHEQILAAYHEALPELSRVKVWEGTRKSHLQARWRERWKAGKYASQTDGVAYWARLFRHVRTCDWLMGRVTGRDGRAFKASLGWIVKPENFAKLIEGRYDRQEVAA